MVSTFLVNIGSTAAAIVGTIVVLVGLWMAFQAFGDARKAKPKTEGTTVTMDALTMTPETGLGPGIPDEVVKVLPDLVKTAAGLAIAVMLLGTALLVGASFTGSATTGASPTPASSSPASPAPG